MLGAALVLALAAMEPREAGRPALSTRLRAHVLDPATLRELGMPATFAAGDRILVPRSAFETLRRRGVPPRGFRLASRRAPEPAAEAGAADNADADADAEDGKQQRAERAPKRAARQFFTEAAPTHCQEGVVCAPRFVLDALGVVEGEEVLLEDAHLPKAAYVQFQAHSSKLAEHPEMAAMLTSTLEGFAALTKGTTIELRDGPNVYKVDVIAVRARPDRRADGSRGCAAWIDNIDLVTDWAAPKDAKRGGGGGGGGGQGRARDEPAGVRAADGADARVQSADATPGRAVGASTPAAPPLAAETFEAQGMSALEALADMVMEEVRCDPVVQLLVVDRRVVAYVCARGARLCVNALRWATGAPLLPPVGVAPKDTALFATADPEPTELLALRLAWLAHALKAVALFALGMPPAAPFAWPDAVRERTYGGRYGFLGGWSAPWLDGWPWKGVFPAPWTGEAGVRRWRHFRPSAGAPALNVAESGG